MGIYIISTTNIGYTSRLVDINSYYQFTGKYLSSGERGTHNTLLTKKLTKLDTTIKTRSKNFAKHHKLNQWTHWSSVGCVGCNKLKITVMICLPIYNTLANRLKLIRFLGCPHKIFSGGNWWVGTSRVILVKIWWSHLLGIGIYLPIDLYVTRCAWFTSSCALFSNS